MVLTRTGAAHAAPVHQISLQALFANGFSYVPLGGIGPHGTIVVLPAASLASSDG